MSLDFKCPRDNLTEVDFAGRQTALLVAKGPYVPYCNHSDGVHSLSRLKSPNLFPNSIAG